MMTLPALAAEIGCHPSTLRYEAARRGWKKTGRDWLFSPAQAAALRRAVRPGKPGRRPSEHDPPAASR